MKAKLNDAREWMKEHKKEVLLAIGVVVFTIYKTTIGLIF